MTPAQLLRRHGRVTPGLTRSELSEVEVRYDFTFAPDHRALLSEVLPTGQDWPDWRHGNSDELRELVSMPSREQQVAAADGHLWLDSWGPRPDDAEQLVRTAVREVAAAPALVPLHAWRYVLSAPARSGSPVFSYFHNDTIIIARDITHYVDHWAGERNVDPMVNHARPVPFWTELTEMHARPSGS